MMPADNTNLSLIPFPTMDLHSNSIPKKKKTKGRRKIEIMKIENKNRKNVAFTKRRKGLFKKAGEIAVLCGATVAVIVFSEAGKVFPFGHPSVDGVIDRYIHGSFSNAAVVSDQRRWWDRSIEELGFEELEPFGAALMELRNNLERRIMDLEWQSSEFDDALLVQQMIAPRCNMNGVSVSPEFVSNYNHQQYQYGRCGCMGISSMVAMANPN